MLVSTCGDEMVSAPLKDAVQEPAAAEKPPAAEKPAGKAGGVYIPPFKLAQMLREAKDETSAQYQRLRWDALRKSLNGLINKVNKENIKAVLPEIFGEVSPAHKLSYPAVFRVLGTEVEDIQEPGAFCMRNA